MPVSPEARGSAVPNVRFRQRPGRDGLAAMGPPRKTPTQKAMSTFSLSLLVADLPLSHSISDILALTGMRPGCATPSCSFWLSILGGRLFFGLHGYPLGRTGTASP